MTYRDTLTYLYEQLPMYQRVGNAAFKKGLDNTLALLKFLDDPHTAYPCIHIAGTNGKGTVSHMLAACYQAAGLKVGLYTSPHYKDFRERFKINGEMVSKPYVSTFVERMKPAIEEVRPSFFEITVAMAFDAFRREGVDIAVIETGLGGRLDSTNVIDPVISIITNISYDHMEMLGETLPEIAGEKAGIIKLGRPVVIGRSQPETDPVFKTRAIGMQAPITFADTLIQCNVERETWQTSYCNARFADGSGIELRIPSASPFVGENLTTTLASLEVLNSLEGVPRLVRTQIKDGLENFLALTSYIGRWQVLGEEPLVLADSAHNDAGLGSTIPSLLELPFESLHIVMGVVREKDLNKALRHFPRKATYYFCRPNVPRGLEQQTLRDKALDFGLSGKAYSSVRKALAAARARAGANDLIFVGGSSFVVAEVV